MDPRPKIPRLKESKGGDRKVNMELLSGTGYNKTWILQPNCPNSTIEFLSSLQSDLGEDPPV